MDTQYTNVNNLLYLNVSNIKIGRFTSKCFYLILFSVLVAKNDVVKISDFGTSRTWNEKSTKMSFAGTVAWMAPEVIRNEPCSEKVDIW